MAEEKFDDSIAPTSEDMDILRVLLHKVRGISPVSTIVHKQQPDE